MSRPDYEKKVRRSQMSRGIVHSRSLVSLFDSSDEDFDEALDVFQKCNGSIVKWETHYGVASLILTEGEFRWMPRRLPWRYTWMPRKQQPIVRLFLEMKRPAFDDQSLLLIEEQFDLVRVAEQQLRRSDRIVFVEDIASFMWSTIESSIEGPLTSEVVSHTENRLDQIRGQLERAAERSSQLTYLVGMGLVAPFLVAFVVMIGFILRFVHPEGYQMHTFVATLIAGGTGAFVSVLSRMSHRQITLTPELGLGWIQLLGAIRPLLGVVFAAVAYFAFTGNLIGVTLPGGNANFWALSIVGFLAGFSERFAQEMFLFTGRGVGASVEDDEEAGEDGSLRRPENEDLA